MAKKKKQYLIRYWTNIDKLGEYIVNEDEIDVQRNDLKKYAKPQ